jgi:hypothetical protein
MGISAIIPCFSGSQIAGPINNDIIISQHKQRISRDDNSLDWDNIMNICDIRNDNDDGKKFNEFRKLSTNVNVNVYNFVRITLRYFWILSR